MAIHRIARTAAIVLLALMSCDAVAQQANDSHDVPIPADGRNLEFGLGYNSVTDRFRGFAVEELSPKRSVNGAYIQYSLDSAESSFELAEKMGLSASASVSGLTGSANASYSFAQSSFSSKYSLTILVKISVRNTPERLSEYMLENRNPKNSALLHAK